ncbi:GBF-interacting protein 1-like [Momordica charantia]|uniref:GBF-interacting protein 1-like n=1 Tax=Momordica charantia TaxID=3673 RepID=A0A6J1C1G9_MOMCH|nr:GBF-interacting protein 1-like [Momordica charantia]
MSGGGSRVSIPPSVRKTIENIKEITGNHSDDEIYAMLRECSMDPNETTQKLLLQDTFHEVKSKRERRKENANNRESVESRWKTGMQGRGGRGGRINSSPRYISHDAGGGRNPGPGKENGVNQAIEKGGSLSIPTSQEMKNKEKIPVTSSVSVGNGSTSLASGSVSEVTSSLADISGKGSALPPINAHKNPNRALGTRPSSEQPIPNTDNSVVPITLASSSSALSSSSLDPSSESQLAGSMDAIKCDGGSSLHPNEPSTTNPMENKLILEALEISNSLAQENQPIKSPRVEESQLNEISPPSVSMQGSSTVSLPSNYNKRPQQVIGPHKASSNKEWKPKTTNSVVIQQSRTVGAAAATSEVPAVTFDHTDHLEPASRVLDSEEATLKLQKKLEELNVSKSQLVILPNHIQVPESERSKLSFGSFGIGFGVSATVPSGPESDQRLTPVSEASVDADENVEEEASSYPNALRSNEDVDSPDRPQSPTHIPENLSPSGGDLSSSTIQEYNELKQETGLPSGGNTNSVAQTSSSYSFGLISPVVGSQIAAVENSDSQGRDASRLPSFVVQQPFDPSSYYAQFYRSGENDGRLSPFLSPGVAAKYNGNVALLSPSSSQSPQEGVVLTTAGPTALLTQAAGLMQSSIAVTQQPVPVFRPPAGVHISHYPPNYIPYGHYFSPFYVPPPPIHQFVGNNAFTQQPQGGNIYPAPPAATAAVKYSIPQYKMGANSGNSSHIGVPSGYGPYGSSAFGYSPSTAAPAGNTTANEELGASQFKENSVYITGPQSEGSAVWIGAPGRDMSSLPANSFYNLPPQGQHVTFTPTQTGHGTFAGIYHPAQAVTAATVHPLLQQSQAVAGGVDTVGPGGSIYQQPQHSQINWPSNN